MASLTNLLFPAVRRHLPYSRWWNIAARTVHLAATGVLLCAIPFMWDYRVPMLLAVVGLASIGSHAPRKLRHYSVWYRRVMID